MTDPLSPSRASPEGSRIASVPYIVFTQQDKILIRYPWFIYGYLFMGSIRGWPLIILSLTWIFTTSLATAQGQIMVVGYFGELPPGQSWNRLKDDSTYEHEVDMIAAHRTLPIGTRLRLTHQGSSAVRSVVVTVLDRGPFIPGRDLDISTAAARQLGIIELGIAKVKVEVIAYP